MLYIAFLLLIYLQVYYQVPDIGICGLIPLMFLNYSTFEQAALLFNIFILLFVA